MTALNAIVPPASPAKASASDIKNAIGKSQLDWFALNSAGSFGSTFAGILNTSTTNAVNQASDPTAQLTALLQNGTSLSTIVNTIAQSVSGSVAQRLSGQFTQSQINGIRSSLIQTITNALSPPANAPPGTAAEEAAALAARLQNLISVVARETETITGQQNEISGSVLDANSAKELPAQAKTSNASSTLDASSLASSLLAGAMASLNSPPTGAFSSIAASAQSAPTASASSSSETAPASSITMSNAPDLLARMLVRAAGVDATVNGSAGAANANSSDSSLTTTALAARFASAIADVVAEGSASSGGQTSGGFSNHGFDTSNQSSTPSTQTSSSNVAITPPNVTTLTQQLLQPLQTPASGVDVNSIIEQMIKGMTMRTTQGSSEIHLNLQPENLGAITMRLTVNGSQISASVVAQNADVRNALMSNHQQLARSLSNAGLTLSGFSVDVSGGDSKQQNQGQSGLGRRYVVHELNGPATNEIATTSALGPPLNGGSGVALFNYLA